MRGTTVRPAAWKIAAALLASAMAVESAQTPGAGAGGQDRPPDPRSRSLRECRDNPYNCADTPNPLSTPDTVWLEEMTWMDVRDAMQSGKTTVIVPTGGIEPNGPWLALGKHNYVMQVNCDRIARKLGNALCAPIVKHVPEGAIEPPSGSMITVGTISMRRETFEAILTDTAHSLKVHGFENIIFVGDSGGNQSGQAAVANRLTAKWNGKPLVAHIPEYYDNASVAKFLVSIGVTTDKPKSDNLHDEPFYTFNMLIADPESVRWSQRVKRGMATIDGVSIADKEKSLEIAQQVVDFRADTAVAAIRRAIADNVRSRVPD
jgi:creatinine amidohydrolase/Fe(II)-dependent formamide hydrolase-like protein